MYIINLELFLELSVGLFLNERQPLTCTVALIQYQTNAVLAGLMKKLVTWRQWAKPVRMKEGVVISSEVALVVLYVSQLQFFLTLHVKGLCPELK